MRYLLDTHVLIWSQDEPEKLPAGVAALLLDPANERILSVVSSWEIAIKMTIGKLTLSKPFRQWIETTVGELLLVELGISLNHLETLFALPASDHKDPFDRLLAAQALSEGVGIVSNDAKLDQFGVSRIWS